jgi:hypothetical protein
VPELPIGASPQGRILLAVNSADLALIAAGQDDTRSAPCQLPRSLETNSRGAAGHHSNLYRQKNLKIYGRIFQYL